MLAFECFMKMNFDESQNVVNHDQYVTLKCVHDLKELGYKFTVSKFADYDKLSLLKKMWNTHASTERALEVMSYICIGYNIHLPRIWNGILKQMVALNMIKQLAAIIEMLSTKGALLREEGLAAAWQAVIMHPFKSANRTRSVDQEMRLAEALFRLQSCPLAERLNLLELAELCVTIQRVHMAAVLIPFGNRSQQEAIVELVRRHQSATLEQDLIELEEFGIYPIVTKAASNALVQQQ